MLVTMHTQRCGFISLLLLASIATSAEAAADEPANEAEARGLAQAFEKAVMSSDAAAVRAAFDIAALNRRALGKPADPEAAPAGRDTALASGASAAISDFVGVGRPQIEQGASFGLLHLYHDGDEQRALFRLIYPNGGVGYLDCICVRHAEGKLRIDDAYSFEAGEMLSENLRRKLWLASEKNAPPPAPAAEGSISDGTMLATALREIKTRINGAKYQEALDISNRLPERLQKDKAVLGMRLQAARGLKGEPYDEAIRAYRKAYPDERNLDLIMIDAYSAHKLFDRVLASIDGLDRTLGGDPYLDTMRSQAYFQKGDLAAAKRCARKEIEAEPDLPAAYFCGLAISVKEKDFAATSALLTTVRDKFPRRMPVLKDNPDFAEYVKSPQYSTWANAKKP